MPKLALGHINFQNLFFGVLYSLFKNNFLVTLVLFLQFLHWRKCLLLICTIRGIGDFRHITKYNILALNTEIEDDFTCFTSGADFLAFLRVIVQLLLVLALCLLVFFGSIVILF